MTRKRYQMPVDELIDSPVAITLPTAAFGMLARLALHYWASRCTQMPAADHELMHIARAHAPTWRHWKTRILQAFETWRPTADAYFHARENKLTTIKIAGARGGRARAQAAEPQSLSQSATDFHQLGFVPRREPERTRPPTPENREPRRILTDS